MPRLPSTYPIRLDATNPMALSSSSCDAPSVRARISLAVILLAGAALRFYHLETPSLWWDEILVPLTASHGLDYILDFCRSAEMHPPLFYLVSKAAMGIGLSDFSLRLLPSLLGTGSIYLLYRIARAFTDENTALFSAAILSVNGLHLLLSREIRPYALQLVLLLVALRLLVRLAEEGRWRDLAGLCLVNMALFWLHYFTFHMAAAQGAALALCLWMHRPRFDLKHFAVFCVATAATALPVFAWFFLPSSGSRSIFSDAQYSRWNVFDLIADYLGQALFFFDGQRVRLGAAALALGGFAMLALRRPRLAAICLILVAVPLANVLVMGKAAYFSPWHVAYATPLLAFFMAQPLSQLPFAKALAAVLAVAGCASILSTQQARYYEVDSYRHPVFVTLFKPMAKHLAGVLPPDGLVVGSNPGFVSGVDWYMDQYSTPNPLRSQRLVPGWETAQLRFVSAYGDFGVLGRDETDFLARQGRPLSVEKALNATVYTFRLTHDPAPVLDSLPMHASLAATSLDFFRRVASFSDATFCPIPGIGITATANDHPGSIEYVLDNGPDQGPVTFFLNLQYLNIGLGNLLGLYARFDDEPRIPLAGTAGPDPKRQSQTVLTRDKPFKRVTFTVELLCRGLTAQYHGGNLETLAFRGLDVFACRPGETAQSQAAWERANMESMRLNYGAEAFVSNSATPHDPKWSEAVNLDDTPSSEVPGWRVLAPKDPDAPAVLTVEAAVGPGTIFYPRLAGSDASVQVLEVSPDGTSRPVLLMAGVPVEWTPISAQYPLILPPGPKERTLRIELRGRYCQLWHKDGAILF
ncbi:glycosyltransferase family 39 protein [Fundidesulfovibrio terrae]|uniref:glycosyltransferase family 39 protein n=1 Tax=Fundidesulfovibrio terrae TaxID=2922866 RepID=UPI001FAFD40A|nr:glycosyltransferase family 39 protein [Fundidesulfovibrio terrae]